MTLSLPQALHRAISAMREGQEKSAALKLQAVDARNDAQQEQLAGAQRADALRRQLLEEQGQRDAATAAGGVDLSFGTPAMARAQADDDSARALSLNASSVDTRSARYLERAANYQTMARSASRGGMLKALGIGANTALSIQRRG
jgi:hypothetical protein